MKRTFILCIALATFWSLNVFGQQTTKIDWAKDIMCTMQYDPVCWQKDWNQTTYWNSCSAWVDWAEILYKWECIENNEKVSPYLKYRSIKLQNHLIKYQNANSLTNEEITQILQSWVEKIDNILMTSRMLPWKYAQLLFQKKLFEYTRDTFGR